MLRLLFFVFRGLCPGVTRFFVTMRDRASFLRMTREKPGPVILRPRAEGSRAAAERLAAICVLCVLAVRPTPCAASDLLPVWNMDSGFYNELGGGYNHFNAGESFAYPHIVSNVKRGEGGRSLRIDFHKGDSGYCGVWSHLYDENAEERELLDVSEFPFLSFHVKGAKGGEDFMIQVADASWLAKEDSSPVAPVSAFLEGGITTNWQEVLVPVEKFWVDAKKLGGLTFNFTEGGEGSVFIDDIVFKRSADTKVPEAKADSRIAQTDRALVRAMWVWETKSLMNDEAMRKEFLEFCRQQGVNEIFLQMIYRFSKDETGKDICELLRPDMLRSLMAGCTASGIKVHALDGYPEFALESEHPKVLAQVRAVLDYNASVAPEERFRGIHLDNEPYQILGFDGALKGVIFRQFFALNRKVMDLLKEEGSHLVYGIDIPNWFDEMDPPLELEFEGSVKNPAEHLIDICDNVGIMDYRTFAYGVDGMIHHALGEIDYANRAGKKIYLGVETFKYKPTKITFLYGSTEKLWKMRSSVFPAMKSSTVNEFKVRTVTDGFSRFFGLAHPSPLNSRDAFDRALMKLNREFKGANQLTGEDAEEILARAETMISRNPEYDDFESFVRRDEKGNIVAVGFTVTEHMLDKITFAGKPKAYMESVLAEVAEYFYDSPSFVGFAVHYYSTWKAMPSGIGVSE